MKIIVEYDFPEITSESSPRDKENAIHNLKFHIESRTPSMLFPKYNYVWKIKDPEYTV